MAPPKWKVELPAPQEIHLGEGESIRVPIKVSAPTDGRLVFAVKVSSLNNPEEYVVSGPIDIQAWPQGLRRLIGEGALFPEAGAPAPPGSWSRVPTPV